MNELTKIKQVEMTSNQIAELTGKEHKHVMRDIRILIDSMDKEISPDLHPSTYIDKSNRVKPNYTLSKDGVMLLITGYSVSHRMKLIKYCNELEMRLSQVTNKKMLLADLFDEDKMVVVNAHKKLIQLETQPLLNKIEEDKPMVDFANIVSDTSDTILIREFCKLAQDENFPIGERKLYTWLRKHGLICKNSTEPTQKAMNLKIFKVVIRNLKTPYGDKMSRTTKVTGKGQIYLMERLRKELIA